MAEQVKESKKKANPADRLPIPGPGRPKGSKNKITTDMKEFYFAILNHEKMNGLDGAVAAFSKNDKNKIIFYQSGFRMLPTNVNVGGDLNVTYRLSDKFMPNVPETKKDKKGNGPDSS